MRSMLFALSLSCLLLHVQAAEEVSALTTEERAFLVAYAKQDPESIPVVHLAGKRLHQVINNPGSFGAEEIAGAIVAHEAQNFSTKEDRKCWNAAYVKAVIDHRTFFSPVCTAAIAENLRMFMSYPNAKNEALAMINRFDYISFTDDLLRGKFYSVSGYAKLNNKAFGPDDAVRDFHGSVAAFRAAHDDRRCLGVMMEEIKAKMIGAVYEKYQDGLEEDFAAAVIVAARVDRDDSLHGSLYHTRGLHRCNMGMKIGDVELMRAAQNDLRMARDHKRAHPATANNYASTLKISGDATLRMALRFNQDVATNIASAKDLYLEAFALNPNFTFDEYNELLRAYFMCLKAANQTDEFATLLNDYNGKEELNANFRAAIQYTLAMMRRRE